LLSSQDEFDEQGNGKRTMPIPAENTRNPAKKDDNRWVVDLRIHKHVAGDGHHAFGLKFNAYDFTNALCTCTSFVDIEANFAEFGQTL